MLNTLTKIKVRGIARRAWIESGNNSPLAEEMFRQVYQDASDQLRNEALSLAFGLWQFWIDTNQSEPSVVCTGDEPMGFED